MSPAFSLILSTVNRTEEVRVFLDHLRDQTCQDFECLIIDQNFDRRTEPIIKKVAQGMDVRFIQSVPGISKSRNVGLRKCCGDIIAFPDDDCWYQPNVLEFVWNSLEENPSWDGVIGTSNSGGDGISRWKFKQSPGYIDHRNVWQCGLSITMFLRRSVISEVGEFDETLGLGASTPWQSGEDTDYLLRAIEAGYRLYYQPELVVSHDDSLPNYSSEIAKGRGYGEGMGRVLRKHQYSFQEVSWHLLYPFGVMMKALINNDHLKAKYFLSVGVGRLRGWALKPDH